MTTCSKHMADFLRSLCVCFKRQRAEQEAALTFKSLTPLHDNIEAPAPLDITPKPRQDMQQEQLKATILGDNEPSPLSIPPGPSPLPQAQRSGNSAHSSRQQQLMESGFSHSQAAADAALRMLILSDEDDDPPDLQCQSPLGSSQVQLPSISRVSFVSYDSIQGSVRGTGVRSTGRASLSARYATLKGDENLGESSHYGKFRSRLEMSSNCNGSSRPQSSQPQSMMQLATLCIEEEHADDPHTRQVGAGPSAAVTALDMHQQEQMKDTLLRARQVKKSMPNSTPNLMHPIED